MKNYEEIRGQKLKLEFDASSNSFIYVPLNRNTQTKSATTLLFKPRAKPAHKIDRRVKAHKHA